jgi:hypothetical protein
LLPYAYTFELECASGAAARALRWCLQGRRGASQPWRTLDARELKPAPAPAATAQWLSFLPPAATGAGFTALRLIVRDAAGAVGGGHARRWPARGGLCLRRWRVWCAGPDTPRAPVAAPRISLTLCGAAGLRRLRVTTSDGAVDAVSARVVGHGVTSAAVALARGARAGGGGEEWIAGLWVNGELAELVDVGRAYAAPLFRRGEAVPFGEESGGGDGGGGGEHPSAWVVRGTAPPAHLMVCPDGAGGPQLQFSAPHGGCAFTLAAQLLAGGAPPPSWLLEREGAPAAAFPLCALAADADPAQQVAGFEGVIWGAARVERVPLPGGAPTAAAGWAAAAEAARAASAFVAAEARRAALPPPCAPATAPLSAPFDTLAAPLSAPFDTLEAVALWQPSRAIHGALRSAVPVRRRYAPAPAPPPPRARGLHAWGVGQGLFAADSPLVLYCHDCGPTVYVEDAAPEGVAAPRCATSAHGGGGGGAPMGHAFRAEAGLSHCDVFSYFSHARVSPPPRGWVEAAHAAGALALGAVVTEWAAGEAGNELLTEGVAEALGELAHWLGFDGWLVNVEAAALAGEGEGEGGGGGGGGGGPVCAPAARILRFLGALRGGPRSPLALWYDSTDASTGAVAWANALTPANAPFFAAADAIFLNYAWSARGLRASAAAAGARARDVLVGVDVWGRGCPGGGGWRTGGAAAAAVASGTSLALFAPAWTYEAGGGCEGGADAARALEEKLWWGATQLLEEEEELKAATEAEVGGAAAALHATPLPLANAAWEALPPPVHRALRDTSPRALEAAALWGWAPSGRCGGGGGGGGGGGWAVEAVPAEEGGAAAWAARQRRALLGSGVGGCEAGRGGAEEALAAALAAEDGAPEADAPAPAHLVASFGWCHAWQDVDVVAPEGGEGGGASPLWAVATVWVRGTPPNCADPFKVELSLRGGGGGGGATCSAACSAACEGVAGEQWARVAVALLLLPAAGAPRLRLSLGAIDAEHWQGHFGARLQRPRLWLVRQGGAAPPPPRPPRGGATTLSAAVGGPRSAFSAPPYYTCWDVGAGCRLWEGGRVVDYRPWVRLGAAQRAPAFPGALAVAAGCAPLGAAVAAAPALAPPAAALRGAQGGSGGEEEEKVVVEGAGGGAAGAFLVHTAAWTGGAAALLRGARAAAPTILRLLPAAATLEAGRAWTITLIFPAPAGADGWPTPVLLPALAPSALEAWAPCGEGGGGAQWLRARWRFEAAGARVDVEGVGVALRGEAVVGALYVEETPT